MFHQTYSSDITLVLSLITEWIILILFTYFYLVYVVEVVDIPGFGEEFIAVGTRNFLARNKEYQYQNGRMKIWRAAA